MATNSDESAQLYLCPAGCGRRFGTVNGVAMHAVNVDDQQHRHISGQHEAIALLIERERCRP